MDYLFVIGSIKFFGKRVNEKEKKREEKGKGERQ